jgi:hypothetical protein
VGPRAHADVAFEHQDDDPDRSLRKRADALGASIDLDYGIALGAAEPPLPHERSPAALALVKDIFANTRYDEHELKRARRELSIVWQGTSDRPSTSAWRRRPHAACNSTNDPAPAPVREAQIRRHRRFEARRGPRRRDSLRQAGCIGFSGDVTLDEAKRAASGLLPPVGKRPEGLTPQLSPIAEATSRPREESIPMRRLTQVYLRLRARFPP